MPKAVPHVIDDDEVTGKYEGPDLELMRERRPTRQRMIILERKADAVGGAVREIKGKVDALFTMAAEDRTARQAREEAEAVEREKKRGSIVPIVKAVGVALALIIAALVGHGCG